MDAAQIAGLNCLRLMNDTTAGEILMMDLVHLKMKLFGLCQTYHVIFSVSCHARPVLVLCNTKKKICWILELFLFQQNRYVLYSFGLQKHKKYKQIKVFPYDSNSTFSFKSLMCPHVNCNCSCTGVWDLQTGPACSWGEAQDCGVCGYWPCWLPGLCVCL